MAPAFWALLVLCVFSFKLPLFGGSVNGPALRADDIAIAIAAPFILYRAAAAGFFTYNKLIVLLMLGLTLAAIWSAIWASTMRSTDTLTAIAYAIRPLEYGMFAPLGFLIARSGQIRQLDRVLAIYSVFFGALCLLQFAGINIAASQFNISRAAGNTSGPYEAAVVASFLLIYFAARRRWALTPLPLICLLLTQSRITVVAMVVVALFLSGRGRWWPAGNRVVAISFKGVLLGAAIVTIIAVTPSVGLTSPTVTTRLEQTQILKSWSEASLIAASTPAAHTPVQYTAFAYDNLIASNVFLLPDASSVIRFSRWQIALKAWAADPPAIVWGMGPSFAGAALDGYYVRLVVGQGVIGLLLFAALTFAVWRQGRYVPGIRRYIVVLLITGLFIDIFVSYRPMILLWLVVGLALSEHTADRRLTEASVPNRGARGRTATVGVAVAGERRLGRA